MDVCLFADKTTKPEDIMDWVQPDLFVVCNPDKIGDKYLYGAPDLVIEVLSPSTARNDRMVKYNSYQKAGVRDYWIVDPYNLSVEVYLSEENTLKQAAVYGKEERLKVNVLPELQIDLKNIFKE